MHSYRHIEKWKVAVLFTYVILLAVAVTRHEPWFDEAQAWLLARDASLFELLFKYMRYEGSPGLWHLILFVPAKLGLPYFTVNIIAAVIAAAGTWLFINYAPFHPVIRIMYAFSYFAFYQYAVIARSYVLIPLLLFMIAAVYRERFHRPVAFITLLCLLANVSLHGFIIAGGLAFVHILDVTAAWDGLRQREKVGVTAMLGVLGVIAVLIIVQLKPPEDIITFANFKINFDGFVQKSLSIFSEALCTSMTFKSNIKTFYFTAGKILFYVAAAVSALWFIVKRRFMSFALPAMGLFVLFTSIYSNVWHQGTLFYLWLFSLWIAALREDSGSTAIASVRVLVSAALALVLAMQVYWGASSFIYDVRYSYSASREVADYIKENNLEDKKIYITGFHSISLLPYFKDNIFVNYNNGNKPAFWLWSGKNSMYTEPYLYLSKYSPDIIVMGVKKYCGSRLLLDGSMLPNVEGYRIVKLFDGALYWKDIPFETDSFALYMRDR